MKFIADLFSEMALFVMMLSLAGASLYGLNHLFCIMFDVEHVGLLFEIALYSIFPVGSILEHLYGNLSDMLK
ncbi:hypothetical protein A4G17_08720 [Frederiksenia canicola]|uniref:Uncharacterized protein n=2 Tax=Frederiksenia canicola TaxID=123824 RepID=A0AAE6X737_9PAST|nr:hypothetical protein A4G17_08720 [Frederiksenia canicola]RPE96034.1 hypothetical protein EDC49_0415 [Frederiksenia canicola]